MPYTDTDDDTRIELATEPNRLIGLLKNLHSKRALLSTRVDESSPYYSTTLLKVDPERELIYLDELVPRTGHDRVQPDSILHVVGVLEGVPTHFSTQVVSFDARDGIAFYRAKLPEWIDYQQKRAFFRVHMGPKLSLGVRVTRVEDAAMFSGRLLDVSLGGFGFLLPVNSSLHKGDHIAVNALDLPSKQTITGTAQIRHIHPLRKQLKNSLRVGAGFTALSPQTEQTLLRAILMLERTQISKQRGT